MVPMIKDRLTIALGGLAFTAALVMLFIFPPSALVFLDYKIYDTILRTVNDEETTGIPIIVDIDESSLEAFGQWPWPRYRIAELLSKLKNAGAGSIGLDFLMAEPDRTSLEQVKKEIWKEWEIDLDIQGLTEDCADNDRILAKVLSDGPFVLGYEFEFSRRAGPESDSDCMLHPVNVAFLGRSANPYRNSFFTASDVVCNLRMFSDAVVSSGFLNAAPDKDGILRQAPLLIAHNGGFYPSLALSVLMKAYGYNQIVVKVGGAGAESILVDGNTIPLVPKGNVLIHYRGKKGAFDYLSAGDVLNGCFPSGKLKDRIVFIGASAAGLQENRSTPLDSVFPGVAVQATVADNILKGDFLSRPQYARGLELMVLVALGILFTGLLMYTGTARGGLVLIACIAGLWFGSVWAFQSGRIFLSPLMPITGAAGCYIFLALLRLRLEEKRDKQRNLELLKELRESEAKYRLVVENAIEGIIVTDGKETFFVNEKAKKLTGYSLEDLSAIKFTDLIHPMN